MKVTAPKFFGALHLGNAAVSFSAQHPDIQVSLILEDYSFRADDFVEQGLDVAIRLADLPDSSRSGARSQLCKVMKGCQKHLRTRLTYVDVEK